MCIGLFLFGPVALPRCGALLYHLLSFCNIFGIRLFLKSNVFYIRFVFVCTLFYIRFVLYFDSPSRIRLVNRTLLAFLLCERSLFLSERLLFIPCSNYAIFSIFVGFEKQRFCHSSFWKNAFTDRVRHRVEVS